MQQSNALRKLEKILTDAIASGDKDQIAGIVLLRAMKLDEQPQYVVNFYELLNKAQEEARSIRNKPNIKRYLDTIEELHKVFVVNHMWSVKWNIIANHIELRSILNTLDALADFFTSQNPAIFLEQDFLEKLNNEFENLLDEIFKSDLSKELKKFLTERIEDILRAIRRYDVDGTEGVEKATKSVVSDLVMTEHSLKDKDKNNSSYKHFKAWVLSLAIYITPSPYDIIGAAPDIYNFWVPKFEELAAGCKEVEKIICETPTSIQEFFQKASDTFDKQQQKSLADRERKALPPSKEDIRATTDNKSVP